MTDEELSALYERYAHVLYHRCYSILRNKEEANDAVHETFARVLKHGDAFRGQSSALTWMYKISTNYALNQLRNRTGRNAKLDARQGELRPDRGEPETPEDHRRVLALLDEADDETRAVVIYTFFDDCSRQETAQLVGISVPTVRKRIREFMEVARRRLGIAVATAVLLLTTLPWSSP